MVNELKGSLLAGFDDVLELILKCCVWVITILFGPYIPFIFVIGYFPDILKVTKIQPIFKET